MGVGNCRLGGTVSLRTVVGRRLALAAAIAAGAGLVVHTPARAANKTWDGGGTDNNWTTANNWDANVVIVANDVLSFGGSTRLTPNNNFAANTNFNGINFNSGAGAFVLGGNAVNLGGNINDNATNVQKINLALALTADRQVSVASGGSLQIGGVISGGFDLVKTGSGTLTLNGSAVHTYTGGTGISGGTLTLDFANLATPINFIDSSSALTLNGATGGIITLNIVAKSSGSTAQTFASTTLNSGAANVTVNSNGGGGATLDLGAITRNAGGVVNFTLPATGSITTSTANANFAGGQQTILGGYATVGGTTWAVSGSGATPGTISGLATFDTAFTAGTDVDVPTGTSAPAAITLNSLRFNNAGAATINTGGDLTIATGGILVTSGVGNSATAINNNSLTSGNGADLIVIQNNNSGTSSGLTIGSTITNNGATSIGLTKDGAGTLVVGAANTYSGPTRIHEGTLVASTLADGGANSSIGSSSSASSSLVFSGGSLQYTGGTVSIDRGALMAAGGVGGTIDVTQGGTTLTMTGVVSGDGVTTGHPLTKAGTGTLILGGTADNAALGVTVGAGKLILAKTASSSSIHAVGGTSIVNSGGTLQLSGAGGDQIANATDLTVNTGGTFDLNGLDETIDGLGGGGSITNTAAATTTTLTLGGGNGGATFSGVIQNGAGTMNVAKTGTGTQILSGANTYSGTTTVDGNGTLRLANSNALGSSAGVTVSNVTTTGGQGTTLDLNGSITIPASKTLNLVASGGFRTTLLNSGGNNNWSGPVVLAGGSGTINQFNSASGTLTVSGNISASGSGFSGILFLRGSGTGVISGNINIPSGVVSKTDGSTWTISGTNNVWTSTQALVGTLKVGSTTAVPATTSLQLGQGDQNSATFDLNGFDQTIAGVTVNNSTATSGTSNTKQITNSSATAATLTINNATSNTFTNTNTVNKVLISGNLSLNKTGVGTLTLTGGAGTGQNTYTGSTTITAGTLALGIADRLPDATSMILAGGTFSSGGFAETVGALDVNASSTINLGAGASILHFAASDGQTWTPATTLTISNWSGDPDNGGGTDQVFVGSDITGLTAQQLSQITFTGFTPGAQILPSGEIVPAPEPAMVGMLAMAAVGLLAGRRRRAQR